MRERERAHIPLMFIAQPTEQHPKSMMQYSYSSVHDQTPITPTENEESSMAHQIKDQLHAQSLREVEKKTDEEVNDQPVHHTEKSKVSKKKFADLTIEEKIKYCMKTSPYIPPITCAIKTESKTIVGSIRMYEDGVVHVSANKNSTVKKVQINDITHIRIIGF